MEQTISTINVWYTPGAIGNVIKRTGDNGQGLEPDEGKPSRPVLRGLEGGNTLRLPGDLRLSPHPAQHLGSFLDVLQTIKQLLHFRSRLYA